MMMIGRALTIAGSDSGGGAGVQADLKTFSAFGVYGMSVITSVTAQNTVKVHGIAGLEPQFIGLQFEAVLTDIGIDGVKTGMLYDAGIVQTVAYKLRQNSIPHVVVDPVMVAKGGDQLLEVSAVEIFKREMIPVSTLVTPNIPEAELLAGIPIRTEEDIQDAAIKIMDMGGRAVLIKGGHFQGNHAVDILFDGTTFTKFASERINSRNTHGTGCTYSAAILSNLIQGHSMIEAVRISKSFITEAIRYAFSLGKGHGPLNHFVDIQSIQQNP
jgi:hydroxymethylpyrimidine/phosphomethylpyrimidine kinase